MEHLPSLARIPECLVAVPVVPVVAAAEIAVDLQAGNTGRAEIGGTRLFALSGAQADFGSSHGLVHL